MKKVVTIYDTLAWTKDDHTVRNMTTETDWCLQDRSGFNLWVVDGLSAEGLPLTLAGKGRKCFLSSFPWDLAKVGVEGVFFLSFSSP